MDAQHLPRHLERPRKLEVPGGNMPASSEGKRGDGCLNAILCDLVQVALSCHGVKHFFIHIDRM